MSQRISECCGTVLRMLRTDLRRALVSPRFAFAAGIVTLTLLAAIKGLMEDSGASVWYLLYLSVSGSGIDSLVTCILPVFAFGLAYSCQRFV